MMGKKNSKNRIKKTIFGLFFAIIGIFGAVNSVGLTEPVYAEPATETVEETTVEEEATPEEAPITDVKANSASCKESLGELGWWVCPETGKIAEATDWLYEKIEDILIINPVEMKDGAPIYEIWKYFRGITNLVFIIFMLIVVISQITGIGITNYGIKKALPKLIIAAILVNLSFIICSLAVELSNVFGIGIRDVFSNIETATYYNMQFSNLTSVSLADIYASLAGGEVLAVGAGIVAFETGAIWMLIPVVLGAIVAVAAGLITIALRQAVVTLLIMIAPLAIVAYILPNTEQWFKKWKNLFIQMLVFYPMFSLLFGASSLAGFAIIASAKDGFSLLLGVAVQIFPLFFSWSLMKMSGTFLSNVNAKIRAIGAKPLASTRSWAESRRESTKMRRLASENVYTPSLYLRQYLSDRKIHREEETKENAETVKNRGLAYSARKHYKDWKNGVLNGEGKEAYEIQARNMRYKRTVQRHTNNMNEGFSGHLTKGTVEYDRLAALDKLNMDESDRLKMEMARGEQIDYRNAKGFHERMEAAMNAHMDLKNGYAYERDENGRIVLDANGKAKLLPRSDYEFHFDPDLNSIDKAKIEAIARYREAKDIMFGNISDTQYAAAFASHAYDTQAKIIQTKFQKYFELTPPTRDVRYRLEELARFSEKLEDGTFKGKAVDNIDTIITGLRILNQRGDTDFLKDIMDDILDKKYGGLELGTHASQALASFLMFEVKDSDPYLRRFGKYINLETAQRFDENKRQKETVDYEEYVKGYHIEPDGEKRFAKRDMVKLMEGTSLDGIERTALDNYDASLRKAYTDENGVLDYEGYRAKREEVDKATAPQFISANMKYLSGSEQIISAVKSKTGFVMKQDKDTGRYYSVAIWNDEKEMAKLLPGFSVDSVEWERAKEDTEEFYRNQTLQYLRDQTPAQILGLRSDYKEPLLAHLSASYLLDDNGNEIPEKVAEHNEKLAAIENSDFGETDPEKIAKKRKAAKESLRMFEAGQSFRELLYKKGKLEQIEKSKRSGAANNAKDWVRELLLLDSRDGLSNWISKRNEEELHNSRNSNIDLVDDNKNEEKIQKKTVINDREQQKRQELEQQVKRQQQREELLKMVKEIKERQKQEADPNLTPDKLNLSVYTHDDVNAFISEIDEMWYDMRDNDGPEGREEFFEATRDYISESVGAESYVVKMYEKYYRDNPNGDMYEMYKFLLDLIESLTEE